MSCSGLVSIIAPSRGGGLLLGETPERGANPRRPVFTLQPLPCECAPPLARGQGSLARSPMPIIRLAGCASQLPGPGCEVNDCTPTALQVLPLLLAGWWSRAARRRGSDWPGTSAGSIGKRPAPSGSPASAWAAGASGGRRAEISLSSHENHKAPRGGGPNKLHHTAVAKINRLARKAQRSGVDRTAYPPHSRLSFVSHHAERISIASVKGVNRAILDRRAKLASELSRRA